MKKIITIVAVMMFVLAFVTAFADEMPIMTESRDVGTLLNIEAGPGHAHPKRFHGDLFYTPKDVISPTAKKDFSGPIVSEKTRRCRHRSLRLSIRNETAEGITGMAQQEVLPERTRTPGSGTILWDLPEVMTCPRTAMSVAVNKQPNSDDQAGG